MRGKFTVRAADFPAASMADLGFLLLIFLVVITAFAIEQGIPLVLPGGERVVTRIPAADVLELRALGDGTVRADDVTVPAAAVRHLVESRLARDSDLVVTLALAPDATYGVMVQILDEIERAGCSRVSLRTRD